MADVVILVPGIMGSVLKLGDDVIWPGPPGSLFLPFERMVDLLRPDLVPTDCIRRYLFIEQYQGLIDDLESCGFREADDTLVIGAYDWRKDNADSAGTLAKHIDEAVARHGDQTRITLIAHSMGGLVCRHYLESGSFVNRPGFRFVRRLLTLATPHRGAAVALPVVLGHERRAFLNKDQAKHLTSDPRYPAAYQLLPPEGEPFATDGNANSELAPLNVYDPAVADALGLVASNLASARAFHRTLDVRKRPGGVRYFCFSGTRQMTATSVRLQKRAAGLEPQKIEQEDGGDGTVPTWSSFFEGVERLFVGGSHSDIYRNRELRKGLTTVLGKEGVLLGVPDRVELALRDKVVEPGDVVHAVIAFPRGVGEFNGVLTTERASAAGSAGAVKFDAPVQVDQIQYKGLDLETASVAFTAPATRGTYRVAFRDELNKPPAGVDEMIVQA